MAKEATHECRHCGEGIARIPEWPLKSGGWHHVAVTDEDTMGRYAMDCADESDGEGYEAEP